MRHLQAWNCLEGRVAAFTHCVCPVIRSVSGLPVSVCQNRIVPSALPLASVVLSGENANAVIPLICPVSVARGSPVVVSHNCTVLSVLPLASIFPSGENTKTFVQPVCFSSVIHSSGLVVSHKRTVLSVLPLARRVPSCENANAETLF